MIARALRAEIERSAHTMRARNPLFSGAAKGTQRARTSGPSPALGSLLALLDRGARDGTPAHLAHKAFFQYLAAENGLSWIQMVEERCGIPEEALGFLGSAREECRDGVEEVLDAIDDLVDDPARLPGLRDELREVIEHFDQLCVEVAHVDRRAGLHVSAA